MTDFQQYASEWADRARDASRELVLASGDQKNAWLRRSAQLVRERTAELVAANEKDIEAAPGYGLTSAMVDRLRLTDDRLEGIATALEDGQIEDAVEHYATMLRDQAGLVVSSLRANGALTESEHA